MDVTATGTKGIDQITAAATILRREQAPYIAPSSDSNRSGSATPPGKAPIHFKSLCAQVSSSVRQKQIWSPVALQMTSGFFYEIDKFAQSRDTTAEVWEFGSRGQPDAPPAWRVEVDSYL